MYLLYTYELHSFKMNRDNLILQKSCCISSVLCKMANGNVNYNASMTNNISVKLYRNNFLKYIYN